MKNKTNQITNKINHNLNNIMPIKYNNQKKIKEITQTKTKINKKMILLMISVNRINKMI